jgi:uncharacterized membrane protein
MRKTSEVNTITTKWYLPAGLITLSLIPIIAGGIRLAQLQSGLITPENVRFFASPLPVVLHIISVTIYSLLGAFQFTTDLRQRRSKFHRFFGLLSVPAGLTAALTGLWMTQYYPPANNDGTFLYVLRLSVGITMILFLILGVNSIRQRNFSDHGAWMTRAYALGLGAGTQVFTHLPYFIFPSIQGEMARAFCMGLGWAINIVIAEWIIFCWNR